MYITHLVVALLCFFLASRLTIASLDTSINTIIIYKVRTSVFVFQNQELPNAPLNAALTCIIQGGLIHMNVSKYVPLQTI